MYVSDYSETGKQGSGGSDSLTIFDVEKTGGIRQKNKLRKKLIGKFSKIKLLERIGSV